MYSHDGLRDSLTNLAAPPFFYEELRRGMARVARSGEPLSLIRFVLPKNVAGNGSNALECKSPDDMEILKFAHVLLYSSRGDDLCARLGDREFVVLLYAAESVVHGYVERISRECRSLRRMSSPDESLFNLTVRTSHISHRFGQSALELLRDLDYKPLITCD